MMHDYHKKEVLYHFALEANKFESYLKFIVGVRLLKVILDILSEVGRSQNSTKTI